MNCKKCGYPLFSNDKVCKRCGEEVVREEVPEVPTEEKVNEVPIAPVVDTEGAIPDPTKPIVDPTKPEEKAPVISNGAPIPELATLDAPPKVFEEPTEEDKGIVPIVEETPVDPKEAPIPDMNSIPDPTKEVVQTDNINEVTMPNVDAPKEEETTPEVNVGPIPDPTQPVEEAKEEIKEVSLPQINNGPIEPVVNTEEKKSSIDSNYDKIEGIKSLNSIMSIGGLPSTQQEVPEIPKEEVKEVQENVQVEVPTIPEVNAPTIPEVNEPQQPQIANINQELPSLPNDKKSSSSVIIPTKPKPIGETETSVNPMNKQEMDNYQQQMNNYDESMRKEEEQNNNANNNEQENPVIYEEKKKKNPIVIILILIVLGVGGYFGYKYLADHGILGGKEKTVSVDFNSYKFEVPEKYKTQINTNNLVVYDDTNILAFAFINGSYKEFSQALTLENFNSLGNQATYLGEKQHDGHKYHLYQVIVGEKNAYIGYISISEVKIVCFSVEPKTGSKLPTEDYLNDAIKIALSATFNGSTNTVTESSGTTDAIEAGSQALTGEAASAGDISDEPEYEETYVNITLNEINE